MVDLLSGRGDQSVFSRSGLTEEEILFTMHALYSPLECAGCVKCCQGEAVFLTVHDDPSLYDTEPVEILPGRFMPVDTVPLQLKRRENGDCVYLGEGGCTIYERRPHICKAFDCRGYVAHMKANYTRADRRRLARAMGQKSLIRTAVWQEGEKRLSQEKRSSP